MPIGQFICGFYAAVFAGIVAVAVWVGTRRSDDERLNDMREQIKKEGYHV